ncbi:complement C1q tumor necrosis factor-related protein 3-like [Mercenaria mercenaria]|uniref:complement C1q tumor necrosis factor-related protein 3-like n=1 Tax=Mercenaria mercenaria TaxID=6596 RepID=UPI00234F1E2F|nr:complement C1q tumor necrosis factor-related protein 3-like [Mercenaria mercenaria]
MYKSLKNWKEAIEKEIDELKQELTNQKDEIKSLHKKSIGQDRLISRLLRRTKARAGSSAPASEDNVEEVQKISVQSNVNRIKRSMNKATVAFTAGLTHIFDHAGVRQNIVFDHVETNLGNGYNPHHGVFTAPVSGLYVFYSSILADMDREVWCRIVVNGNNKASVNARGTNGRYDQGSQAIDVQLQQGDDVSVQNAAADDSIYGDAKIYSTFSGFLLQQDVS